MSSSETAWEGLDDSDESQLNSIVEGYLDFLENAKTEFDAVEFLSKKLKNFRFAELDEIEKLAPNTHFIIESMGRVLAAGIIGKNSIKEGFYIIASHVDSPRIDLKPRPIYEDADTNTVLLKTQYYGGLKKYHWVGRQLSIHGRIVTSEGKIIKINIGENKNDPVFVIPDLLPHIADKIQGERKLFSGIEGEEMNVLFGSTPGKYDEEKFKNNVLSLLKEKYGIEEEDLASSELYLVPSDKPRISGIDESMIVGYGHDDKASAYASFRALSDIEKPKDSILVLFYDKEEIGSYGASGSGSNFLEYVIAALLDKSGSKSDYYDILNILRKSKALSADVDSAMDPSFKQAHDEHNAAIMGGGIVLSKYSGSGGKFLSSEAPSEFVAYLRGIFKKYNVNYQFGTLGRVDGGGGGTVAQDLARYGMSVIDAGPPVMGMHSPSELISKIDLWSAYRAYIAFLNH